MSKQEENTHQPPNLFENIALTFSGGGYRAASFALGVLSYLNEVKFKEKRLLENVKGLTTVSGGTHAGATYAYFAEKGKTFSEYYKHFYNMLNEDQLLGKALKNLSNDSIWKNSHKKRSIINSFALAYAELLTSGTFEDLKRKKSHLEDICFNSSDFSYGLAFRFQTAGDFGNYRLKNKTLNKVYPDMNIADAIAASSCFPLGFEPIIMPDDFISDHDSPDYKALKDDMDFKNGIGLMDGGILDNQGIGSIMNNNKRRKKKGNSYDLIMVCDVCSYKMDPWEQSTKKIDQKIWKKSLRQLFDLLVKYLKRSWLLYLPIIVGAVLLGLSFSSMPNDWLFIAGGAFLLLGIIGLVIKYYIGKLKTLTLKGWKGLLDMLPGFMDNKLPYFQNLKLRIFKRIIEERFTSGVKLVNEIFLKQIRRLNYNLFYTDPALKNRRITTLIYELTKDQFKEGKSDEKEKDVRVPDIPEPGDLIYYSAEIASDMATTLWFSDKDKEVERLKNLIACGQFTACYNLLKYCVELEESKVQVDQILLKNMKKTFLADWKRFNDDPYWLFEKFKTT